MALLEVYDLRRSFYGVTALDGVDLAVERGTITGLIGPNGAGKTTLFNCVSGLVPPDGGRVVFDGADVTGWAPHRVTARGLVRTFQIARRELSSLAAELQQHRNEQGATADAFAAVFGQLNDLQKPLSEVQRRLQAVQAGAPMNGAHTHA